MFSGNTQFLNRFSSYGFMKKESINLETRVSISRELPKKHVARFQIYANSIEYSAIKIRGKILMDSILHPSFYTKFLSGVFDSDCTACIQRTLKFKNQKLCN
jgi:hypothetical protein